MRPESYSSIKTFRDCPRQYRAKYVDRDLPYEQSPAAERGDRIHAGMEAMVCGAQDHIPDEPVVTANAKRFLDVLRIDRLVDRGWRIFTEDQVAITENFEKLDYHDKRAWLRGRLDLVLIPPDPERMSTVVVDWKTGKTPGDRLQLEVATALLLPYCGKGRYLGVFAYLDQGRMERFEFDGGGDFIAPIGLAMHLLKYSWANNHWPAEPGGPGCRWCRMTERCLEERNPHMEPPVVGD